MTMMQPGSEPELAEMVRGAEAPLRIAGGGTRAASGLDATLSIGGISGITLYEPGALTMIARAGTSMDEVLAAVEGEGQRLAFEPWDARGVLGRDGTPTLGGCVATNASGPRRLVAGACRDSVIGVRFVDGTGTAISSGGRVMKNVTGLDLAKLVCGSRGALGVITEVSLKLLPGIAATVTLRADGHSPKEAVAAMSAALCTPYEVSGAVHDPADGGTFLRLEGSERSVDYRAGALAAALGAPDDWRREDGPGPWTRYRDAVDFAGGAGDLWRISVRPSEAAGLVAALPGRWRMDWGGALIWAEAPAGSDLRAAMPCPGHATLVRASAETHAALGTTHPEPAPVRKLTEGIRARFDPRGLFSSMSG